MPVSHNVQPKTEGSVRFPDTPRQPQKCTPADAIEALIAGADDITVAPQVLLDMVTDPLTEDAVEKFSNDWQQLIQRLNMFLSFSVGGSSPILSRWRMQKPRSMLLPLSLAREII